MSPALLGQPQSLVHFSLVRFHDVSGVEKLTNSDELALPSIKKDHVDDLSPCYCVNLCCVAKCANLCYGVNSCYGVNLWYPVL